MMKDFLPFLLGLACLAVFLMSVGYVSYIFSRHLFSESPLRIRWCATSIVFSWFLGLLFSTLMTLRMFMPVTATIVALICAVLTSRTQEPMTVNARRFAKEVVHIYNTFLQRDSHVWIIALPCFLLLLTLLEVTLILPPMLFCWAASCFFFA